MSFGSGSGSFTGSVVTGDEQLVLAALAKKALSDPDDLRTCVETLLTLRQVVGSRSNDRLKSRASRGARRRPRALEAAKSIRYDWIDEVSAPFAEIAAQARLLAQRYAAWSEEEFRWFLMSCPSEKRGKGISPRNLSVVAYVDGLVQHHGPQVDWARKGIASSRVREAWNKGAKREWRYSGWRNLARDYRETRKRLESSAEAAYKAHGKTGPCSLSEI